MAPARSEREACWAARAGADRTCFPHPATASAAPPASSSIRVTPIRADGTPPPKVRFSDWRGAPGAPYDRGVLIRTTIGLGAAAAGLTALTYGIAQAIENGSCGVDEYGNVLGAPCPDGFGPMIVLMVFGYVRGARRRRARQLARALHLPDHRRRLRGRRARLPRRPRDGHAAGARDHRGRRRPDGAVHRPVRRQAPRARVRRPATGARRPPRPSAGRRHREPAAEPTFNAPAPQWEHKHTPGDPEAIAARLRQLDQLKESGLLDDAAYAEQRKRILAEL